MIDWQGKKVLITGASGFIGGAIARWMLGELADVTVLLRSGGKDAEDFDLQHCRIYNGDIRDYQLLCEILSTNEIEYVFHLAANAIVRVAARDPMSTYSINVMGTVALLEACRTVGRCKKIIVASSDKAYGDHDVLPYVEGMALQPKNTYDTSKACSDLIARSYAHNYGMPVVVTRCSNVYGPGDPNQSRIIPNSIVRLLKGEPAELYSDVSEMEREFIYIDDVLNAYLHIAELGKDGEAYNVGGTGAVKVRDMVGKIITALENEGVTLESGIPLVKVIPREPVFKEIGRQFIDSSKLQRDTGWKPRFELEEGLGDTVRSYLG